MQRELPDAIDLLTICVESGLGFDAALQQVARNTEGPLAEEFSRVLREMQIGSSRADALRAMGERTSVADLRTFVGAMVQADAFGIPIAQVLRVQSAEMRVKRRQRAEEKAQQVPVKITIPLIFCILPTLFIVGHGTGRDQHHGQLRRLEMTDAPRTQHVSLAPPHGHSSWSRSRSPACWRRTSTRCSALIAIGVVWTLATLADWRQRLPVMVVITVEAAADRRGLRLHAHSTLAVLGALAVPPFTAGLYRSLRACRRSRPRWRIELVVVSLVTFGGHRREHEPGFGAFSWT